MPSYLADRLKLLCRTCLRTMRSGVLTMGPLTLDLLTLDLLTLSLLTLDLLTLSLLTLSLLTLSLLTLSLLTLSLLTLSLLTLSLLTSGVLCDTLVLRCLLLSGPLACCVLLTGLRLLGSALDRTLLSGPLTQRPLVHRPTLQRASVAGSLLCRALVVSGRPTVRFRLVATVSGHIADRGPVRHRALARALSLGAALVEPRLLLALRLGSCGLGGHSRGARLRGHERRVALDRPRRAGTRPWNHAFDVRQDTLGRDAPDATRHGRGLDRRLRPSRALGLPRGSGADLATRQRRLRSGGVGRHRCWTGGCDRCTRDGRLIAARCRDGRCRRLGGRLGTFAQLAAGHRPLVRRRDCRPHPRDSVRRAGGVLRAFGGLLGGEGTKPLLLAPAAALAAPLLV